MTIPLIILAILAAFGGFINIPTLFGGNARLTQFLAPVFADSSAVMEHETPLSHGTEWLLMGITLTGVIVIVFWTYRRYVTLQHGLLPNDVRRSFPVRLISQKYYIDELYQTIVVKPILWLSQMLDEVVELRFIDRIVNGVGNMVLWTGNTVRYIQTGNVGFYMFIMILGIILILFFNILI